MRLKNIKTADFDLPAARQGAEVVTRRGCPVRIETFEGNDGAQPVCALIKGEDGYWTDKFCDSGHFFTDKELCEHDLMMVVDEDGDYVFPNRPKVKCNDVVEPGYGAFCASMARLGAKVVTRKEKRPMRIICFDRMGKYPIIALSHYVVYKGDDCVKRGEFIFCYTIEGEILNHEEPELDLLMVLDKRGNYAF